MINNKIDYDKYNRQLGVLITDQLKSPMPKQRFWKFFKQAYISHESVYKLMTQPYLEDYLNFLHSSHYMLGTMNRQELDALRKLQSDHDVIVIYRGTDKEVPLGSSYTLDENRAIWFAKRFGSDTGVLTSVTIQTKDIDCLWIERDEQEIFMLPSMIRKKAIKIVDKLV